MDKIEQGWVTDRPEIPDHQITAFLATNYAIQSAVLKPLPGERDRSYIVEATDGRKYIFKIANALEKRPDFNQLKTDFDSLAHKTVTNTHVRPACSTALASSRQSWLNL